MRSVAVTLLFILLFCSSSFAAGESAAALYNQGNKLYAASQYDEALRHYEGAYTAGARDPRLFANMGNAAYKGGKIGIAVWSFKSGLALAPRDEDLEFNYGFAIAHTMDETPPSMDLLVTKIWKGLAGYFTASEFAGVFLAVLFLLCIAALVIIHSDPGTRIRTVAVWACVALGLMILVWSFPTAVKLYEYFYTTSGVLLDHEIQVRSTPDDIGPVVFTIHEGIEFEITEKRGNYAHIRIPTGYAGWIPTSSYRIISP